MTFQSLEFNEAVSAVCAGNATDVQRRALTECLRNNPAARDEYLLQVELHARLASTPELFVAHETAASDPAAADVRRLKLMRKAENDLPSGKVNLLTSAATEVPENIVPFPVLKAIWQRWAALAAVLTLTGFITWLVLRQPTVSAEVLEAQGTSATFAAGQKVALRTLRLPGGTLRVKLDSGALVTIIAPAEVEFVDAMRLRVRNGKVTADVGKKARGFSIETAQARIVDLGTRFGVDASNTNQTDVVVLQGEVKVFDKAAPKQPVATLKTGEAIRVDKSRRLFRIVNVTSDGREEDWSTQGAMPTNTIIVAVRDSMHGSHPSLRNFYRIVPGGLREDARVYADALHEWNGLDAQGIPAWLLGADLVQTFNVDSVNYFMKMTVTVSRPCLFYVIADRRNPPPAWLREGFTDTGTDIGWEHVDPNHNVFAAKGPGKGRNLLHFGVWKLEVKQPGEVQLGAPYFERFNSPAEVRRNFMYGIAAKALP